MNMFSSAMISVVSGLMLLGIFSAGTGFLVGKEKLWPYTEIRQVYKIVQSFVNHGEFVAEGRQVLAPEGASRTAMVLHDSAQSMGSGYYSILGWDSNHKGYSVNLHDNEGALIHTWPIDEKAFSEKAEHRQNGPHAMEVLSDGTLLVSFDWLGLMTRLDACGKPIWSREGFFHHSFSPSADGGIWTWYGEQTAYGQVQDILKFDPTTGKDINRISFNDDVIKRSPTTALMFSMYEDFAFTPDNDDPLDIFHPNDVEELSPELASAFPLFEAGDLMLSIRELNMITVISTEGEIKWSQQGPWIAQHDPDFEPNGIISVYNNSYLRPRSSIVSIDPQTLRVQNAMPEFSGSFKSERRGKHQLLPNGNRLVTIPEQGQALEISPAGNVVLEFNNTVPNKPRLNDDLVNAKWLSADFFDAVPSCKS